MRRNNLDLTILYKYKHHPKDYNIMMRQNVENMFHPLYKMGGNIKRHRNENSLPEI